MVHLEAAVGPHSDLPGSLQELCREAQKGPLARHRTRCSPADLFRRPAELVAVVLDARRSGLGFVLGVRNADLPTVLVDQSSGQAAVLAVRSVGQEVDPAVVVPHKMLLHVALEADNYCMTAAQIAADHRQFAAAVGLEILFLDKRHCVAAR